MVTQVIKSIGLTGRDYADLAGFFAATPASLVAVDEQWIGEVYNDGEIVVADTQTLAARTTDATRNIILRPATGQGFADHASRLTNPLYYDATKGAAIRSTRGYGDAFVFGANYTEVQGLQFKASSAECYIGIALGAYCVLNGNILDYRGNNIAVTAGGGACSVSNNLIFRTSGNRGVSFGYSGDAVAYGNTLIGAGSEAFHAEVGGSIAKNNAVFGFATPLHANISGSSSHNAADVAIAVGTSNQPSLTTSAQFESTTDFRVKTGATLIANGVAIAGRTTDILKQTVSATPTIGAYEVAAAATAEASFTLTLDAAVFAGLASVSPVTVLSISMADAVFSGSASVVATGSLTLPALKNNTGTVLANETGATAYVYATSGAHVVTKTGQTTNASGVMVIADAAIIAATQYRVVIVLGSGAEGMDKVTAA